MTVFVGDTPTIRITVQDSDAAVLDISAATVKQIIVKAPDTAAAASSASFTTDGTDGKMEINYTVAGAPGAYEVQGKVTISGRTYHTEIDSFDVAAPLA